MSEQKWAPHLVATAEKMRIDSPNIDRIRKEERGEIATLCVVHQLLEDRRLLLAALDFEHACAVSTQHALEQTTEQVERLSSVLGVRQCVIDFALAMERQLAANDHKPGWQNDAPIHLMDRLHDEMEELYDSIDGGAGAAEVLKEAADVANFAMMVADRCAQIEKEAWHA